MSEGEFHFSLTERRDRNGDVYLFVGLKMLNSVLFIRPEPVVAGKPFSSPIDLKENKTTTTTRGNSPQTIQQQVTNKETDDE